MSRTERSQTRRKRLMIILGILVAAICVLIGAGSFYLEQKPTITAHPDEIKTNLPAPSKSEKEVKPQKSKEELLDEALQKYEPSGNYYENRKDGIYTFLIAGTMDKYNTDTLMLCSLDINTKKVNVISIPRDSMVDVPVKNKKINATYGRAGVDELRQVVEDITGIYVDYYFVVDVESFITVVDLLGGIDFDVPYDMKHHDDDSNFTINLEAGPQTLDGSKSLQLVRFRGTAQSDLERMEVQKKFLMAVGEKILSTISLSQLAKIGPTILSSVETNMGIKDMLWFYRYIIKEFDPETDISFYTMPIASTGYYNSQSYVYLDWRECLELINSTVNPYEKDITGNDINIIHLEN